MSKKSFRLLAFFCLLGFFAAVVIWLGFRWESRLLVVPTTEPKISSNPIRQPTLKAVGEPANAANEDADLSKKRNSQTTATSLSNAMTPANLYLASLSKTDSLWATLDKYLESNDSRVVNAAARAFTHCFMFQTHDTFSEWLRDSVPPVAALGYSGNDVESRQRVRDAALKREFGRCRPMAESETRAFSKLRDAYAQGVAKQLGNLKAALRNGEDINEALRKNNLVPVNDPALISPVVDAIFGKMSFEEARNLADRSLLEHWAKHAVICSLGEDCGIGSLPSGRLCLEMAICDEVDPVSALLAEVLRRGYDPTRLEREIQKLRQRLT